MRKGQVSMLKVLVRRASHASALSPSTYVLTGWLAIVSSLVVTLVLFPWMLKTIKIFPLSHPHNLHHFFQFVWSHWKKRENGLQRLQPTIAHIYQTINIQRSPRQERILMLKSSKCADVANFSFLIKTCFVHLKLQRKKYIT